MVAVEKTAQPDIVWNSDDHSLAYCITQNLFHGMYIITLMFQKKKEKNKEKTEITNPDIYLKYAYHFSQLQHLMKICHNNSYGHFHHKIQPCQTSCITSRRAKEQKKQSLND